MQIVTTTSNNSGRSNLSRCIILTALLLVTIVFVYVICVSKSGIRTSKQANDGYIDNGSSSSTLPVMQQTTKESESTHKSVDKNDYGVNRTLPSTNATIHSDHDTDYAPPIPPEDAEKKEQVFVAPRTKRAKVFNNRVENLLETLSTPGRRFAVTPVPLKMTKDEIMAYLKEPIQIQDEDDEQVIAAKERTAAMKTEAIKYIENGGSFDDFVQEMISISQEEAEYLDKVRREKRRIVEADGIEAAQAYLNEVNPKLKEMGMKELTLSDIDRSRAAKAAAIREMHNQEGVVQ